MTAHAVGLSNKPVGWVKRIRVMIGFLVAVSFAGLVLLVWLVWLNPAPGGTDLREATGRPGWKLIWSDEFNGLAGTPPDPAVWGYEIGDGTASGNRGWGNNELEYYTDSPKKPPWTV